MVCCEERTREPFEAYGTCPLCCEERGLLVNEQWVGQCCSSTCHHYACEDCVRRWVERQMPACYRDRHLRMRCFEPECRKNMVQRLVLHVSPSARALAEKLDRRFALEQNQLYPQQTQVECPRGDCVGLGYLGFDTVMCFICEHQWLPRRDQLPEVPWNLDETACKPCPRCGVWIEKDGGCDHMECQCGYEFVWTTMAMWEPEYA
mmetsp:Transcript_67274/g.173218  ORF Transcript_67274/g.173218 Transcript_67274/m.173218 type:complete len:205 (+) Transcript_67274:33-647(+)